MICICKWEICINKKFEEVDPGLIYDIMNIVIYLE